MSLETIRYERFPLAQGERVLDLGCGEGRHAISAYMQADVEVVAIDLSLKDLAIAKTRSADVDRTDSRLHFVCGGGAELPFRDATFDKVICSEVLEHVHDYHAVLAQIHRVLKPRGLLAVSVPRFGPEWVCWRLSKAYHEVEGGHVRIFKTRELKAAVEGFDMACYGRHWAHALHVPYWWLRCLFWSRGPQAFGVRQYHRLLVWDLMKRPKITRLIEALLDPLMGKSVVMYFERAA